MKKAKIEKDTREFVEERAGFRCEYCLIPSDLAFYKLEIDHIIPEKQDGPSILRNLALACKPCNCHKGYSVVKHYFESGKNIMLFNPRKQEWSEHFVLQNNGLIKGLTDTGTATVEVLNFNQETRVVFRRVMINNGLWKI